VMVVSTVLLAAVACAHAMRSVGGCTNLPTVEECTRAALRIRNQCLRACVLAQCSGVTVRCGDMDTVVGCAEPRDGGLRGGFTKSATVGSCQIPLDEVRWCELPVPASCKPLIMVHELAHTCGWHHDVQGMGVPGTPGKLFWRDECD